MLHAGFKGARVRIIDQLTNLHADDSVRRHPHAALGRYCFRSCFSVQVAL